MVKLFIYIMISLYIFSFPLSRYLFISFIPHSCFVFKSLCTSVCHFYAGNVLVFSFLILGTHAHTGETKYVVRQSETWSVRQSEMWSEKVRQDNLVIANSSSWLLMKRKKEEKKKCSLGGNLILSHLFWPHLTLTLPSHFFWPHLAYVSISDLHLT